MGWFRKADRPDARGFLPLNTQVFTQLRPYVAPPQLLPPGIAEGAPEILPGIVMAVAVHHGDRVNFLPESSMLEMIRNDIPDWRVKAPEMVRLTAIENLRKEPPPGLQRFQAVEDRSDAEIVLLESQDSFVASRITYLNELADWATGGKSKVYGVVVAIPRRRTVLLHVPSGPGILKALEGITAGALRIFNETPHTKLSPYTYYVAPGGQTQVVGLPDKSGGIVIQTAGPIADVLYGPHGLLRNT